MCRLQGARRPHRGGGDVKPMRGAGSGRFAAEPAGRSRQSLRMGALAGGEMRGLVGCGGGDGIRARRAERSQLFDSPLMADSRLVTHLREILSQQALELVFQPCCLFQRKPPCGKVPCENPSPCARYEKHLGEGRRDHARPHLSIGYLRWSSDSGPLFFGWRNVRNGFASKRI